MDWMMNFDSASYNRALYLYIVIITWLLNRTLNRPNSPILITSHHFYLVGSVLVYVVQSSLIKTISQIRNKHQFKRYHPYIKARLPLYQLSFVFSMMFSVVFSLIETRGFVSVELLTTYTVSLTTSNDWILSSADQRRLK